MKIIFSVILALATIHSFAQNGKKLNDITSSQDNTTLVYRLFPTPNIYNFIKLNTRNGQMWQVQFGMEEDKRFETTLSAEHLVSEGNEINNRFTLYPTDNIYTFILLDQINGKTWQVQWSINPEKSGIMPIKQ